MQELPKKSYSNRASKKTSKLWIVVVIVSLIFVFAVVGFFYKDKNVGRNKVITSSVYLPKLNKEYTYSSIYPNGDNAIIKAITAKISDKVLVSVLDSTPNSEAYMTHFVMKNNEIFTVDDRNPEESLLWLPKEISIGKEWSNESFTQKIIKTDEIVDLGFMKVSGCLLVQRDLKDGSYSSLSYFAPNFGVVYVKNAKDGKTVMKLTGIVDLNSKEAEEKVRQFSSNINKIK